jgi:putative transposase
MLQSPDPHRGHRFPVEIIAYAVWLYHVFSLSLRDVELLLAERGVTVSYETRPSLVPKVRPELC